VEASLLQRCPDLQSLDGNTGAEVLTWALATVKAYRICQNRHAELVKATSSNTAPQPK
jgi:hypothetical protein